MPSALLPCWIVIALAFAAMGQLDAARDPVWPFAARYLLAAVAWGGAVVAVYGRERRWTPPRVGLILLGGALLRLVAWHGPILLETDVHRYLWDGFTLARGQNPYRFTPDEVLVALEGDAAHLYDESSWIRLRELALAAQRKPVVLAHLRQVNHPKLPTCYPPLAQWAFAAAASVAPGDEATWKFLVLLVDLGICLLLVLLLRSLGRPEGWVLAYAWCPLPIKEYANTGHYDPVATLFTVLAVLLLVRRRPVLGGAALGLGIAGKLYPLVLLPVLWRRLGWRGVLAATLTPLGMLAPFLSIGPRILDGLLAFARDWEFNSSIFALVAWVFDRDSFPGLHLTAYLRATRPGQEGPLGEYFQELTLDGFQFSKLITGLLLLAVLVALARWSEDADWSVPGRSLAAIGAVLLLAPVTDPWYLPWLLPYACLFPAWCWLYWSVSCVCYYTYFVTWKYLWWHRPLEYLPFYALLVPELRRVVRAHPGLLRPGATAADS